MAQTACADIAAFRVEVAALSENAVGNGAGKRTAEFEYPLAAIVRDINIADPIRRYPSRKVEAASSPSRTVRSEAAVLTVYVVSDGICNKRLIVFERAVVAEIVNVHIAVCVDTDSKRIAQAARAYSAGVARVCGKAAALSKHQIGNGRVGKRPTVLNHAVVTRVCDVEVTRRIDGEASGSAQTASSYRAGLASSLPDDYGCGRADAW